MTPTTSDTYRRWAEAEARGVSEIYYNWATSIANNPAALHLIESLPRHKRQPNLVFGAARFIGGPIDSGARFVSWLVENWRFILPVIRQRATQTNEAGRCATLLPVLAELEGPLALIEAGASAGLCLYPDQYSYRYDSGGRTAELDPPGGESDVVIPCSIDIDSMPSRVPHVVWRAGVDLNPMDPTDGDHMSWLEALVWPEHDARRDRLRSAASIAASDPPKLVQGDLMEHIPALVEQAPTGAQTVVFHSAVLAYLTPERRNEFVRLVTALPNVLWISNEGESVLPHVTAWISESIGGRMVLAVDGTPVALTGPHGQSYQGLAGSR